MKVAFNEGRGIPDIGCDAVFEGFLCESFASLCGGVEFFKKFAVISAGVAEEIILFFLIVRGGGVDVGKVGVIGHCCKFGDGVLVAIYIKETFVGLCVAVEAMIHSVRGYSCDWIVFYKIKACLFEATKAFYLADIEEL